MPLPTGLRQSDVLPEPIFTPATKADSGHDINISETEAADLVGRDLVSRLRDLTLALYRHGAQHAESCGIIVADTKFEFGLVGTDDDSSGSGDAIILIDRGAHTRLVSVLAKGQPCAGSRSVQF